MRKYIAILVGMTVTAAVAGAAQPIQLSLTPDIALHERTERIEGLSLSIWGENPQTALTLGFVNGSTGDSLGLSLGLMNYAESYTGVQIAGINYAENDFTGWQCGLLNYTGGQMTGLQSGFLNYADHLTGLQLGFMNYAYTADSGVQIGIINIIPENEEWFTLMPHEVAPAMIFLNWRL